MPPKGNGPDGPGHDGLEADPRDVHLEGHPHGVVGRDDGALIQRGRGGPRWGGETAGA